MKEQNKAIRLMLKWLDDCPCEAIISSMAGHIVHIKVNSNNVIKIAYDVFSNNEENKEEKNNER
jgi:hypothetical protein